MTWIKDNKFLVALGGITLLGVIVLAVVGLKGAARYEAAKQEFDLAASEASSYERQPLYPRDENRDGKSKALDDYKEAALELQQAFEPYRSGELENISPQAFTDQLKAVNDELLAAFDEAGIEVPEEFFSGFERYKTSLANREATGILKYQLDAIRYLMLALAESGASGLRNLYRPALAEEAGRQWQPGENQLQVARELPLEITFVGPEKAARQFLSALADPEPYFTVVRTLRIANTKKEPPMASDAQFDNPAAAAGPAATAPASPFNDIFGEAFVVPDAEEADTADDAEAPPAPPPPAPQPTADSSRILDQVLGNEEVLVFVRLDLMQFLPAKTLP